MVLSIPCGLSAIRVYQRPKKRGSNPQLEYRAAQILYRSYGRCVRLWGPWATSISITVTSLLQKSKLKQDEKDAVWAETLKLLAQVRSPTVQPAMSHKTEMKEKPHKTMKKKLW